MPRRTESYDKMMAEKFKDVDYAHEYLIFLVEKEKLSVEDALIHLAKRMGEKEFAALVKTTKQKVNDFIKGRQTSTINLLNQFLQPLGFQVQLRLQES